jgi:hypothetical protein
MYIEALPEGLRRFAGRIIDVDTHEMMPLQAWVPTFGPDIQPLVDSWLAHGQSELNNLNHPNVPGYPGDVMGIDPCVYDVKGSRAPGATNPLRRLDVMDALGVNRQLMFPGVSGYAMLLALLADNPHYMAVVKGDSNARRNVAEHWMRLYDRWSFDVASKTNRIRPVAPIIADTIDDLLAKAKYQIGNGIRAFWLPSDTPPGRVSPAHSDLDPFWALMAKSDSVVTLHVGADAQFLHTREWGNAPVFDHYKFLGEFNGDPWNISTMHLAAQNFLTTMVVGGVMERHPGLRVGVIELGAWWIGPLMEGLDLWYANSKTFNLLDERSTPQPPSHYIRRNVRVTPYSFEDVGALITKYDLADMLCFSTDYPHLEGGKGVFNRMYKTLAHLGGRVVEKYFVTNGEWLFPG